MTKTIITDQFNAYKADCEATNEPIIMDEFVFAYIPDLDPTVDIDPNETLPPESQIVGRFPVSQKGKINNDAVVYSIILGSDIGSWKFNWIGLNNKNKTLVGVIQHTRTQEKIHNDPTIGQAGDSLVRNIVTPYKNAAQLTQITVDAEVWQIDFTQRLKSIDERTRIENKDRYAQATFINDAWKVQHSSGSLILQPGVGYLEGLRCDLEQTHAMSLPSEFPTNVYLTASFHGQVSGEHAVVTNVEINNQELSAIEIIDGKPLYRTKLAHLPSSDVINDLRQPEWRQNHLDEKKNPHPQYQLVSELKAATTEALGLCELATQQEVELGATGNKVVTAETLGKKALIQALENYTKTKVNELKDLIFGGIPNAALDTIVELAAAYENSHDAIQSIIEQLGHIDQKRNRVPLAVAPEDGYLHLGFVVHVEGGLSQYQYIEMDGYLWDRSGQEDGRIYGFTGRVSVDTAKKHGYAMIYQSGLFASGGRQWAYIRNVTESSFEVFCQSEFRYTAAYGIK